MKIDAGLGLLASIAVGAMTLFASARGEATGTPTVPLSYFTTFIDRSGTQKSLSFTGTADGSSLTGTLIIDGAPEHLTATIGPDGSVSGKLLTTDGTRQLGVFWGRRDRGGMKGSFDRNGEIGEWSVPASKLPPLPKASDSPAE